MNNISFPLNCPYCNKELLNHLVFSKHLNSIHQIKFDEWYIKNYLNNQRPKCANPDCGKFVEYVNGKFKKVCSRRCRIIVVNKSGVVARTLKKNWTQDKRDLHSKKLRNVYNNDELRKKISDEVKKSLNNQEIRDKISKRVVESMVYENSKSKNLYYAKNGFKKNGLNNLNFKNQYELEVFKLLDNDTNVSKWYYECVPIMLSNNKYTNVDLEIFYKDGTKKIVEIRHKNFPDREYNRLVDIKNYCDKNGYVFEVWSEYEIESLKNFQTNKTIWGLF